MPFILTKTLFYLAIKINAGKREDLLAMATAVKDYVDNTSPPAGYEFIVWGDSSVNVRDRLDLLRRRISGSGDDAPKYD